MYLLFILIAAFAIAIVDSLRNHFSDSVFSRLRQTFWNPEVSRLNAPHVLGVRWDAETLFTLAGLFVLIVAVVLAQFKTFQILFLPAFWQILLSVVFFVVGYNYFLKNIFIKTKTSTDETTH